MIVNGNSQVFCTHVVNLSPGLEKRPWTPRLRTTRLTDRRTARPGRLSTAGERGARSGRTAITARSPRPPGPGLVCGCLGRTRGSDRAVPGGRVSSQKRFTQHIQTFNYLGKVSLWENLLVRKGKHTQRGKGNGSGELFRIISVMP